MAGACSAPRGCVSATTRLANLAPPSRGLKAGQQLCSTSKEPSEASRRPTSADLRGARCCHSPLRPFLRTQLPPHNMRDALAYCLTLAAALPLHEQGRFVFWRRGLRYSCWLQIQLVLSVTFRGRTQYKSARVQYVSWSTREVSSRTRQAAYAHISFTEIVTLAPSRRTQRAE